MSKTNHCHYCGIRTTNHSGICNACAEKLKLIRKLRAIVFAIKHDAEKEKQTHGETRDHSHTQTVQKTAC